MYIKIKVDLKKYRLILLIMIGLIGLPLFNYAQIHHHHHYRPDQWAPLSIMGGHIHPKGTWMMSYRYMTMSMNELNTSFFGTGMEPSDMSMKMHMAGMMFAPSDVITLSIMVPYLRRSMTMKKMGGMAMSSQTDGMGDPSMIMLIKLFSQYGRQVHLNTGVNFPLGDINQKEGMELGSGTFDMTLGGTYLHQLTTWSYGVQLLTLTRLGTNSRHYRLGDRWQTSAWIAKPIRSNVSVSSRLTALRWGDIEGTYDDRLIGGHSIELGIGLNYLNKRLFSGHQLATEIAIPVYQSLNGVQLKTDWKLSIGWQRVF